MNILSRWGLRYFNGLKFFFTALKKAVVLIQKNPVKSNMGVHRVLVSLLDFKSSVACQKRARWVRFPHAPAKKTSGDTDPYPASLRKDLLPLGQFLCRQENEDGKPFFILSPLSRCQNIS